MPEPDERRWVLKPQAMPRELRKILFKLLDVGAARHERGD
jgi:hypothetical protein